MSISVLELEMDTVLIYERLKKLSIQIWYYQNQDAKGR
jgi:hypothetical protein